MVVSKLLPGTTVKKKISTEFCFNMGVLLAKFHRSVLKLNHTHKGWLNRKFFKCRFKNHFNWTKKSHNYFSFGIKEKG